MKPNSFFLPMEYGSDMMVVITVLSTVVRWKISISCKLCCSPHSEMGGGFFLEGCCYGHQLV